MSLLTSKPHPRLQLFIRQFASSAYDAAPRKALFPAGSFRFPDPVIRVAFHFSDTIPWFEAGDKTFSQPRQNVRGLQLKPVIFNSRQSINVFSIEFTPAGFIHFFNLPCSEIDFNPQGVHSSWFPDYQQVVEKLNALQSFKERIHFLNHFFLAKLRSYPELKKTGQLHQLILTSDAIPGLKTLTEATFTTERSFRRFFNRYFGISPKLYLRLCRFEKTVVALRTQPGIHQLDLALQLGYYDQSHFINEFKAFTGVAPVKLFTQLSKSIKPVDPPGKT